MGRLKGVGLKPRTGELPNHELKLVAIDGEVERCWAKAQDWGVALTNELKLVAIDGKVERCWAKAHDWGVALTTS